MILKMRKKCQLMLLALGLLMSNGTMLVSAQSATFVPASDKSYTISGQRGDFGTKNGFLTSTATPSAAGPKGKFAFVAYDEKLYLYSVADKMFMYRDKTPYRDTWCNVVLSNEIIEPIEITTTNNAYPYYLTSGDYVFNTYSGTQKGVCLSQWTKQDAGNLYKIEEAGDFDPAEALATLTDHFSTDATVTYNVRDVEGHLLETQTLKGKSGSVVTAVPADFVCKAAATAVSRTAFVLHSVQWHLAA